MWLRTATKKLGRVVVGMSGGVDSSVSAYLLKLQGYDVVAVHMVNWDAREEESEQQKTKGSILECFEKDYQDVQNVCKELNIPCHQTNFVQEYWQDVFQPTLDGYAAGITPNPDVLCNRHIKFDLFLSYAMKHFQADYIATGHYARLQFATANDDDDESSLKPLQQRPQLLVGKDTLKDQSYFLSNVTSKQLEKVLFPIGHLNKTQVRNIARISNLPSLQQTALRKESYGMCFVGKRNFQEFIHSYVEPVSGVFIDVDTNQILQHSPPKGSGSSESNESSESSNICEGSEDNTNHPSDQHHRAALPNSKSKSRKKKSRKKKKENILLNKNNNIQHEGFASYTVGQGARIGGMNEKWYVTSKDLTTGNVYVCKGKDHPKLWTRSCTSSSFSWTAGHPPQQLTNGSTNGLTNIAQEQQHPTVLLPTNEVVSTVTKEDDAFLTRKGAVLNCLCRVRYRQTMVPCTVRLLTNENTTAVVDSAVAQSGVVEPVVCVVFDEPVEAVAPGQIVALYDGVICLGGGNIDNNQNNQNKSNNKSKDEHKTNT